MLFNKVEVLFAITLSSLERIRYKEKLAYKRKERGANIRNAGNINKKGTITSRKLAQNRKFLKDVAQTKLFRFSMLTVNF